MPQHQQTLYERPISLDQRLEFAASGVEVEGHPGSTVSSSLSHTPAKLNAVFGSNEQEQPVIELTFEFLESVEEPWQPSLVRTEPDQYAVEMHVGAKTGRIYRLAMKGGSLQSQEDLRELSFGIQKVLEFYVQTHDVPLRQQAIIQMTVSLVVAILPELAVKVRGSVDD